jgi:hypothetical protein
MSETILLVGKYRSNGMSQHNPIDQSMVKPFDWLGESTMWIVEKSNRSINIK